MKLKLFITMCLTFFGITTMVARTEQVKKGPLIYEINTETKKAAVTGFNTIDPWAPPLDTVIILPEIEGYPVTSIKQYAFYNCLNLRDLTIPGSVTYIAKEVFNGCEHLNTVTFQPGPAKLTFPTNAPSSIGLNECPIIQINLGRDLDNSPFRGHEKISKITMLDGLNYLPGSAFSNCKRLTAVEFTSTIKGISSDAFRNCTSLKSISIPPNIEHIQDNAFYGCTALREFIIEDDTDPINLGYSGRYTQAESPLISCPITRFHMGRNIELDFYDDYIGLLHSGPDLTLSIGKNVSKIKSGLFSYCEGLHEIEIPDNVTEIGASAFYNCENLKYVKMSNSVETYEYDLFGRCYKLQKIEMSQNLKTLKIGCFLYCMALEEISIPASVTEIDNNSCFSSCTGLRSLRFEDSTTPISIGDLNISSCPLEEIYIGRDVSYSPDTYNRRKSPFSELESLNKVTLGDAVSKIPAHMFERNPITEFHFPNSIKSIGTNAFSECPNLTTIVFPNSLSIIEYGAFYGCKNLTTIVFPDSLSIIGDYAFSWCNISKLILPKSVTSIGEESFRNNDIKTLVLYGATTIGNRAFTYSPLVDTYCFQTTPPVVDSSIYLNGVLHVPYGCKDIYSSHMSWGLFREIVDDLDPDGEYSNINDIHTSPALDKPVKIYNLQGLYVGESLNSLPAGIYIINGKKYLKN